MNVQQPIKYIQKLIRQGRYSFSREEAAKELQQDGKKLSQTLKRLTDKGWVSSFCRGFYLVLDVQHQEMGLDPKWFIDDWARFVGSEYYVAGLSAAALHGAAHQRPMSFQVISDRQYRSVQNHGLQVDFFHKRNIHQKMWSQIKSPAGFFHVGIPEITAYDIVKYERICPSLDLAATVIMELGESLRNHELAQLVNIGCAVAPLQKLGWLLERAGWNDKADAVDESIGNRRRVLRPLDSRLPAKGERNKRWRIIENTDIQPDIER